MKKLLQFTILLAFMLAMCSLAIADTITVGTGTATSSNLPITGIYGYNYTQQIYTQAQINTAGNISKIRFYYVSGSIATSKDWVIYMGHTTKTTFSSTTDWEPLANLTQVFAGDVSSMVPLANNWMEITLTTPFNYNNTSNLIIAVDENTPSYSSMSWGAFTSGTATGIYYRNDTTNPDPATPPTANSTTNSINRIQFVFPNSSAPLAPTLLGPANGGWALTGDKLVWNGTAGGSDANTYDVYFGTSATPPLVSDNQTGTSYTPTLTPGTTYYWYVTAANEIGNSPASPTWSFKTPTTTQLAESFESTTFPPAGWARTTTNTTYWGRSTTQYSNGVASMYVYSSSSTAYSISTPKLTITGTSTLDFYSWAGATSQVLQVLYSSDRTTWTQLGSNITHATASVWQRNTISLASLAGNNYYLAIQSPLQSTGSYYIYVDQMIGPEITPEAPGPVTLSTPADVATDVYEYTAFTWTAPATGGIPTGYKLYVDTVNPPVAQVADINALTYTLTAPLAYGTAYYWSVAAYNGAGTGAQATARSFTTRTDPTISVFPYTESFDGTTFAPTGWTNVATVGTTSWDRRTAGTYPTCTPHSGAAMARYNSYSSTGGNKANLITPPLNLPSDNYRVKFWMYRDPAYDTYLNEVVNVYYNTAPSTTGATLLGTVQRYFATAGWYEFTYVMPAGSAGNGRYIIFEAVSQFGNNMFLDDVLVEATPAAPIFSLTPTSWDFGQTQINTTPTKQFTISNTGGGTISVSSINISGSYYSLTVNPAPVSLNAGQSATFTVQYAPTVVGTHTGTVTITDNRTVTTVNLNGTCYDPTVTTFPWTENFDSVTVPALPSGWTSIDNNADGDYWKTWSTYPNSSPNCASIYTDYNSANDDYLVTPPIVLTGNQRLKFYTRAYSTSEPDEISILLSTTTPTAAAFTNELMASTAVNYTNYTMYTVDLSAYTGTCYISFTRKNAPADGWYLILDDVLIENIPAAPIFSYTPTSINFGMIQQNVAATAQNITITNTGAGTLNIGTGDISITGTNASMFSYVATNLPAALTTGQSVVIPVTVTVTAEGPVSATLTITNSQTRTEYPVALSANGLPAGVVIVGNGVTTQRQPFGIYFGYERSASVYTATQLGTVGMLNQLWWNCATSSTNAVPYKIYAGTTSDAALTASTWDSFVAGLTLVDEGTHTFDTTGWNNFVLDTPFRYTGNNLIIAVETYYGGSGIGSYPYFQYTTGATGSHQYWNADTNPPTSTGSLNTNQPNLMLQFGALPTGMPDPVTLTYPANGATDLPKTGFNLTWSPASTGGAPTTYGVYMADSAEGIYEGYYWETSGTSLNPLTYADGPSDPLPAFGYNEDWYWTVEAINTDGSAVVDPPNRFTIQGPPPVIGTFPYVENFETHADNSLPNGWSRSSLSTGWEFGSDLSSSYWDIPTHTVYAAANDDAAGNSGDGSMDLLVMPQIDLSGATPGVPILSFDSYFGADYGQLAYVEASTDGTTWTDIFDVPDETDWAAQTVALNDYIGQAAVYIRFHADDNGQWASGWAIDNVSIYYSTVDTFAPVVEHYPMIGWPLPGTPVIIEATATDNPTLSSGIASVVMNYSIDGGTTFTPVPMTLQDTNYVATIPAQVAGTTVQYYIVATDLAPTPNVTTTDTWDFVINVPVTLQYDSGTSTTGLGVSSGTFGVMTGFPNDFGTGNPIQINSISAGMNNTGTANVHVYTYDSVNDVLVDVIPSFNQSFTGGVYQTIPLTNCITTAGYFYVAFTDVTGPNYFSFDGNSPYYPNTHFLFFGAGADLANLGTVEGSGFPGSWLIRAEVQAPIASLDAPAVTATATPTGVELSWNAITGANSYKVLAASNPYAAEPWTQLTVGTATTYTYTGTDDLKFFKVVATTDAPSRSRAAFVNENSSINRPTLRTTTAHKASIKPLPKR